MDNIMKYEEELEVIRSCYKNNKHFMTIPPKPMWLKDSNPLIRIYRNFQQLKDRGQITYGCIVQANSMLFSDDNDKDCPADIIIADNPTSDDYPDELLEIANELFSYKSVPNFRIPKNVREVAKLLKNEYRMEPMYIDYSKKKKHSFNVYNVPIMVYREHLYERKITQRLYPVIYLPENPGIAMILPSEIYNPRQENKTYNSMYVDKSGSGLRLKM